MCVPNKSENLKNISKYQTKQFKNLKTLERGVSDASGDQFKDVLSVSTLYTKQSFELIDKRFKEFQKSHVYKVLFMTTQPAHVIMIFAIVLLAYLWQPYHAEIPVQSRMLNFIHLGTFCMYLGSQFWMTFVSGLSLFFNLPRHHFGEVQRILFPKYFTLNSILTFIILLVFTQRTRVLEVNLLGQTIALSLSFIVNLATRLYLTPSLLRFLLIKINIEKSVGLGMEIGTTDVGPLRNCPHYLKIHQSFRRVHMSIAAGNILTMGCTIYHLYYLSSAFCIL